MSDQWQHGRSTYMKHKCRCEICVKEAQIYRAKYKTPAIKLNGGPFIDRLVLDGQIINLDKRVVANWRKYGMSIYNADRWAIALGYHPAEIWGFDFYEGCA